MFLVGTQRNKSFEATIGVASKTNEILELPKVERNWKFLLEEKSLRKTPLWKEALNTEGRPLALKKHIFSALMANYSSRILYGESTIREPLTADETLCAAEIMSSRVKIPSIEEIRAKRKAAKTKGKGKVDASAEHKDSQEKMAMDAGREEITIGSAGASKSKKRKALFDPEEDLENIVIKIPRGSAAIADASVLNNFVEGLLLEEDESRLRGLGPIEASKKAVSFNYQVSLSTTELFRNFLYDSFNLLIFTFFFVGSGV